MKQSGWLRFSIRNLLIFVTMVTAFSWYVTTAWRQKRLVESLESDFGAELLYDFEEYARRRSQKKNPNNLTQLAFDSAGPPLASRLPDQLVRMLGKDLFSRVTTLKCRFSYAFYGTTYRHVMQKADQLGSIRSLNLQCRSDEQIGFAPAQLFRGLKTLNINAKSIDATTLGNVRDCAVLVISTFDLDLEPLRGGTKIRCFHFSGQVVEDLSPLSGNVQMKYLAIPRSKISSLAPLQEMQQLEVLDIGCDVQSLDSLGKLKKLRELRLVGGGFSDISPVESMTQLEKLSLRSTQPIDDLTPLSALHKLESLQLTEVNVDDLYALKEMKELRRIDISGGGVRGVRGISSCQKLVSLDLQGSKIDDLKPLEKLTRLTSVNLAGTAAANIAPATSWPMIEKLNISRTRVTDLSPLVNADHLFGLSVEGCKLETLEFLPLSIESLSLRDCQVKDFTHLAKLTKLMHLDLGGSNFTNVRLLSGLLSLEVLIMGGCPIEELSPLSGMDELYKLDLSDTKLSDLSGLPPLQNLGEIDVSGTAVNDFSRLFDLETNWSLLSVCIGERELADQEDDALPGNVFFRRSENPDFWHEYINTRR